MCTWQFKAYSLTWMHGALTFTHVCVDSSWTVLEHHRSFIPSTLVSQLEEKKNTRAAARDQIQSLLRDTKVQKLLYCNYSRENHSSAYISAKSKPFPQRYLNLRTTSTKTLSYTYTNIHLHNRSTANCMSTYSCTVICTLKAYKCTCTCI